MSLLDRESPNPPVVAVATLLLLGVGLRTVQYLARTSLYDGELRIARNVDDRGLAELVGSPLDHLVVAPPGFLAAVETSATVLGTTEYGLRFVPWILGLAALFLFWRVSRPGLGTASTVAGLGLFSVSPALIWYGASAKQYIVDVAATLFLVWLALHHRERRDGLLFAIVAGAIGGATLFLSHPAVPTAFFLGCVLLVDWFTRSPRPRFAPFATLVGIWGACALATSIAATRLIDSSAIRDLEGFWAEGGYPPPLSSGIDVVLWLPRQLVEVFAHFLVYQYQGPLLALVALPSALAIIGLFYLARRDPGRTAILLAPIAAGVLVGVLQVLPFRNRVAVYAGWPILVFAMWGIEAIRWTLTGGARKAAWVAGLAAAPPLLLVLILARPPYAKQESRPVIEEIARKRAPGDLIYVSCSGEQPMAYYGPRAGIEEWVDGPCDASIPEVLQDIGSRVPGTPRLWVVGRPNAGFESSFYDRFYGWRANRSLPPPDPWRPLREYLEPYGTVVDSIIDPLGSPTTPAVALLYDLSPSGRAGPSNVRTE